MNSESVTYMPQSGEDDGPCYAADSFAKPGRRIAKKWREDPTRWQQTAVEAARLSGPVG